MVGVDERGVPWMRSPIRLGGARFNLRAAPAHGEHTDEVLRENGYSQADIEQLLADKVIRQAP